MLLQDWATLPFQMSFTILEKMEEGSEKRVEKETRRGRSGGEKKKEAEGKIWKTKRWLEECLKKNNTPRQDGLGPSVIAQVASLSRLSLPIFSTVLGACTHTHTHSFSLISLGPAPFFCTHVGPGSRASGFNCSEGISGPAQPVCCLTHVFHRC